MINFSFKTNSIIFFTVISFISLGFVSKKQLTPSSKEDLILSSIKNKTKSDRILSDIKTHPYFIYHPHSEHYIFTEKTVENNDLNSFKNLAIKLSNKPDNFPESDILIDNKKNESFRLSEEKIKNLSPLSESEVNLISKYWLQLLPYFHPELLKCLAYQNPTTGSSKSQPSNCPKEILYKTTPKKIPKTVIPVSRKIKKGIIKKCSSNHYNFEHFGNFYTLDLETKFLSNKPFLNFKNSNLVSGVTSNNAKSKFAIPDFTFPVPYSKSFSQEKEKYEIPHGVVITTARKNFTFGIEIKKWDSDYDKSLKTQSLTKFLHFVLQNPNFYVNLKNSFATQAWITRYFCTLYSLFWAYSENSSIPKQVPLLDFSKISERNLMFDFEPKENIPNIFLPCFL